MKQSEGGVGIFLVERFLIHAGSFYPLTGFGKDPMPGSRKGGGFSPPPYVFFT
jgi:hypothetical protein